ncbi:MAG: glycosyltransferase family 4 protein [Bacteroidales bacterium]|nr:glycosyltransferase family 4 protein [Bacteroidales bacterium]
MRKVLIITYYWPPSGGGGVMRWLKFAKYLPSTGWQPVIFTPENPDPSAKDESLIQEIPSEAVVIKLPIWEPYDVYRKLTGKKKEEKFKAGYIAEASSKGWKDKLSVFIRGNLMIPDPRKFWVRPAVKFLVKYLEDNPVDVIVSTGPPHSMHLIGMELRRKLNIPWLADFRDPWTNIDFYDRLRLTSWANKKHKSLEKQVLQAADLVTTVSWSWAADFKRIVPRDIEVITNGFDPEDFQAEPGISDQYFSITHIGSFNKDRNPEMFWEALDSKAKSDDGFRKNLRLRFVGQTDRSIFQSLEKNELKEIAEDFGFVGHKKSLEILGLSQVLLLPLNDAPNISGIIPGKLFEYLAAKRPIIVIGPNDGDAARIIIETGAGKVAGLNDRAGLRQIIDEYYQMYLNNKLVLKNLEINKYSRQELTVQLAKTIEQIIK